MGCTCCVCPCIRANYTALSLPSPDARADDAERVLHEAWAERDQQQAVASEDLYLDIVRYAHQVGSNSVAL